MSIESMFILNMVTLIEVLLGSIYFIKGIKSGK